MIIAKEHVIKYRKLFLDAIDWYSKNLVEDLTENRKHLLPYVENPDYNLVADLKKRIESGNEIIDGKTNRLLESIVGGYHTHLRKLKEEPWIRGDTIDEQVRQFDEMTSQDIVKIKETSALVKTKETSAPLRRRTQDHHREDRR